MCSPQSQSSSNTPTQPPSETPSNSSIFPQYSTTSPHPQRMPRRHNLQHSRIQNRPSDQRAYRRTQQAQRQSIQIRRFR